MAQRRHETPLKRINPSGRTVWVARYTGRDGKRRSGGTFQYKRDAQAAIDAAYDRQDPGTRRDTVGEYFETWLEKHPRSARTNRSYDQRMRYVLDVELDGLALRDWPLSELRRRHGKELLHILLVKQKRAANGAQGVIRVLSTFFADALDDELALDNPFYRIRVRANDPRVEKPRREVDVYSFDEMHNFARRAALTMEPEKENGEMALWRAVYAEPMVRVLSDCGLRLGELLALRQSDLKLDRCDEHDCRLDRPHLHVRYTAHEGRVQSGTKTDHGEPGAGRVVPVPGGLEWFLRRLPPRIDTMLLFPTPRGKVWRERNWIRDVWEPAFRGAMRPTRHEFRHSWNSLLRAAGVDHADLAAVAGHSVETQTRHYTHALGRSHDAICSAVLG